MTRSNRPVKTLLLPAMCFAALFTGCTQENPSLVTADAGTLPPSPASAVIFENDGTTPAAGANITVFETGSTSRPPVAAATADSAGRFTFVDLPTGEYAVWAEKSSFVLCQNNVIIATTFSTLHDDTLEFPSQLTLRAGLQPFHDVRTVTVRLAGSDRSFTGSDSRGWITATGLAQGTYTFLFETSISGYIPAAYSFNIQTSSIDSLRDTITLAYTGLPAITGVTIHQDTVSGMVTLSWPPPKCRGVQDFLLFKGFCTDTAMPAQPFASTTDTVFFDKSYCYPRPDQFDTARRCFSYYIAARDNLQQAGPAGGPNQLTFAPKSLATTFFSNSTRWIGTVFSVSVEDTAVFTVSARNKTRALRKMQWFDPSGKDTLATRTFTQARSLSITDSLHHVFRASGPQSMFAIVTDEAGTVWVDTLDVWISGSVAAVSSARKEVR